jgi:hypothetical protein
MGFVNELKNYIKPGADCPLVERVTIPLTPSLPGGGRGRVGVDFSMNRSHIYFKT